MVERRDVLLGRYTAFVQVRTAGRALYVHRTLAGRRSVTHALRCVHRIRSRGILRGPMVEGNKEH